MIAKEIPNGWRSFSKLTGGLRIWTWSLGIFLFTLVQDVLSWPILQFARVVSPIKNRDTSWVLVDAECYQILGSGIYGLQSETGCPGYIYGSPLLRTLNFLHLGQQDTIFLAYTMRALFVISIALILNHLRIRLSAQFLLVTLLLLSPGVQLMLYNSNFDLLIFAMVVFGYLAIVKEKITLGLILIFLSAIFKFYTIPLLLLFFILLPQVRYKVLSLLLFICAVFSATFDLRLMQERIPSGGYAQFGITIFAKYFEQIGIYLSPNLSFLVSTLIFFIAITVVLFLCKMFKRSDKSGDVSCDRFYLVMATVFLSCFVTGLSYDPRLIYLTLAGFLVLRTMSSGLPRAVLTILLFIASYLSCGIELGLIPESQAGFHPLRVVQLLNDVAIEILAAMFVIQMIQWFIQLFYRQPR